MSDRTGISWAANSDGTPGATWNPIVGCALASPGCTHCYAMRDAARVARQQAANIAAGRTNKPCVYAGLTKPSKAGPVWTGELRQARDDVLLKPLHWRKPRCIFVNSMGDLHLAPIPWRDRVYGVMANAPQHTFIVLTKRAEEMREYCSDPETPQRVGARGRWPLPHVWHGVSAEDQTRAQQRIPLLQMTPSAVRLVSAEPLLDAIDLTRLMIPWESGETDWGGPVPTYNALSRYIAPRGAPHGDLPPLDWIIAGGESGDHHRPFNPDHARALRDQCFKAHVPFWFKQHGGANAAAGGDRLDGEQHHERPPLYQSGALL